MRIVRPRKVAPDLGNTRSLGDVHTPSPHRHFVSFYTFITFSVSLLLTLEYGSTVS